MRLLADENIAPSVSATLRKDGHDVETILDHMPGATDEAVMAYAISEQRMILTHDRDFGNVTRFPVAAHNGVILVRCRNHSPSNVIRILQALLQHADASKLNGSVCVVTERGTRIYRS